MPHRRLMLSLAFVAALTSAACGDPPDKEIQQAQGAIDAAKAVGADQYAHEEFAAAQSALKNANDAVAERDYRLALNHALDARDRARTAARQAADHKAAARVDADRALGTAAKALDEAHARLKTAEASRAPARTVAAARRTIAAAEQAVQKARAAYDAGDYPAVIETANGATPRLQAVTRDLDSTATGGPRRRR